VPISVTAITGNQLSNAGIVSTNSLAMVTPSLTISNNVGAALPRLRGVGGSFTGAGIENSVATYVDGVYIAAAPAGIFSLAGVERIEVLKGPQGTLFGRNATGGLIQVVTKKPSEDFQGEVSATYGNYSTGGVDGYVTGGIAPGWAADFAFHASTQGEGYGKNRFLNIDSNRTKRDLAFRSQLMYSGETTNIRLAADYSEIEGTPSETRTSPFDTPLLGPANPSRDPWDSYANVPFMVHSKSYGLSLTVNQELSFADFVSITAIRKGELDTEQDSDTTPNDALYVKFQQDDEQFSQEIQFVSKPESPVSWVVGAYYFDGKSGYDPVDIGLGPIFQNPAFPISILRTVTNQDTKSYSMFGQATVPITEATNITAGLRYTDESKYFEGVQSGVIAGVGSIVLADRDRTHTNHEKLTWRLSVDHRFTPDIMVFASYNRGFKSGGYNSTAVTDEPFRPEQLDAYEVGLKGDFFDGRLRFNPSLFFYDYKDLQITTFTPQATPLFINGPKAEIYGLDVDFEMRPIERLTVRGGMTVIHGRFGSLPGASFVVPNPPAPGNVQTIGNARGKRIPFTPDWSATVSADYEVPVSFGKVTLSGTWNHSDGFFTAPDNIRYQEPYDLVNTSIRVENESGGLYASLWGRNMLDEAVAIYITGATVGGVAQYQPPRTYGVTVGAKF
jgi:iron complex outermembrane recepter protein